MSIFILGLIIFFVPHLWTSFVRVSRHRLISKMGEGAYKGIYSLITAAGLALIVLGWREADGTVLYVTTYKLVYVTQLFVLIALILLAAAYLPAGKLAGAVKHPMLAAVIFWAVGHLLVNGDVRSIILFGSFLAYALIDRIAVKKRGAAVRPSGPVVNDMFAVAVGVIVWAAIYFYLHKFIAGVPLR